MPHNLLRNLTGDIDTINRYIARTEEADPLLRGKLEYLLGSRIRRLVDVLEDAIDGNNVIPTLKGMRRISSGVVKIIAPYVVCQTLDVPDGVALDVGTIDDVDPFEGHVTGVCYTTREQADTYVRVGQLFLLVTPPTQEQAIQGEYERWMVPAANTILLPGSARYN